VRLDVDHATAPITLEVRGERYLLGPGGSVEIDLR
jgi:hypothetical protein